MITNHDFLNKDQDIRKWSEIRRESIQKWESQRRVKGMIGMLPAVRRERGVAMVSEVTIPTSVLLL